MPGPRGSIVFRRFPAYSLAIRVQLWRRPARCRILEGAELDWVAGDAQVARRYDHVPRLHLRMLDGLRHAVDGTARHARGLERLQPVGRGLLTKKIFQLRFQGL